MAEPAVKEATYDDLLALPEHIVGEIVDGVLYAMTTARKLAGRRRRVARSPAKESDAPFRSIRLG